MSDDKRFLLSSVLCKFLSPETDLRRSKRLSRLFYYYNKLKASHKKNAITKRKCITLFWECSSFRIDSTRSAVSINTLCEARNKCSLVAGSRALSHGGSILPGALSPLSPPGLSPLTVQDSAFSTPTTSYSTAHSRFTFDHVPYRRAGLLFFNCAFTDSLVQQTTMISVSSVSKKLFTYRSNLYNHKCIQKFHSNLNDLMDMFFSIVSKLRCLIGALKYFKWPPSSQLLYNPWTSPKTNPNLSGSSMLTSLCVPLNKKPGNTECG